LLAVALTTAGWVARRSRKAVVAAICETPSGRTSASRPSGNSALKAGPVVALSSTVWAWPRVSQAEARPAGAFLLYRVTSGRKLRARHGPPTEA
jgi:hypothetical protein